MQKHPEASTPVEAAFTPEFKRNLLQHLTEMSPLVSACYTTSMKKMNVQETCDAARECGRSNQAPTRLD